MARGKYKKVGEYFRTDAPIGTRFGIYNDAERGPQIVLTPIRIGEDGTEAVRDKEGKSVNIVLTAKKMRGWVDLLEQAIAAAKTLEN
jgi:hypothetical protein